jgi:hypothetical protein
MSTAAWRWSSVSPKSGYRILGKNTRRKKAYLQKMGTGFYRTIVWDKDTRKQKTKVRQLFSKKLTHFRQNLRQGVDIGVLSGHMHKIVLRSARFHAQL